MSEVRHITEVIEDRVHELDESLSGWIRHLEERVRYLEVHLAAVIANEDEDDDPCEVVADE